MFNFCPSCSSKKITFTEGKFFLCPDCGFTYYHNIAAATGCLISVPEVEAGVDLTDILRGKLPEKLVFMIRGKEPAAGKLDLPGGFVDAGEGVFEGLYREMREEMGWMPPVPEGKILSDVFRLFASFPNVYEYKGINYNTCDMYFYVQAPGLRPEDLHPEPGEIAGIVFLKPEEIDYSQFAFPSTVRAVKFYLNNLD